MFARKSIHMGSAYRTCGARTAHSTNQMEICRLEMLFGVFGAGPFHACSVAGSGSRQRRKSSCMDL